MRELKKRVLLEWIFRGVSLAILVFGIMGLVGRSGQAAIDTGVENLYDDTLPLESPISFISALPKLESHIRFDKSVIAKGGQEISLKGSNCALKVNRIVTSDRSFEEGSEYIVSKVVAKKDTLSIQATNTMYQPGGFEILCQSAGKDWRQAKIGEIVGDLGSNFSITE